MPEEQQDKQHSEVMQPRSAADTVRSKPSDQPETGQSASESEKVPDILTQMFRGGSSKERIIREVFTGLFMGPAANPIAQKVTAQHIDKILEADAQKQRDTHSHQTHKLLVLAGAFVVSVLFILALAYMFRDKEALISHLLTAAFALLTGLLGGFGLGRTSRDG